MAGNRIKGITVEIGGDTTKLQTALKGVNTEIRNTQSQLKDVEKLLKLDPGNTELIAQKHRLLAQAVSETREKLEILKDADAIFREEIANAGLERSINQYFAVLTGIKSVGVMGDGRTYDNTIALRGVTTTDFMTADWARIPYEILEKVSNRIVNEVKNVNRVVYDITSKPPATIEFE